MPKRKSSRKCNEEPSATRKKVSSTSAQGNRDSMFNEFTRGLGQVAVLTSSPSVEYNRTNEFKNTVMSQLEEEMRIVEAHIVEVFDKLEKNFGRAGKTVYNSSSLGAELPYHEAVVKAIEMVGSNRSAVNPRINTYNSNNSENMPPSTQFRSVRRSMSVEPVGPHTTILSHRPRPSKSCDRLGLLKTPATHSRTFNYGIATVTPHPQLLSQTTNNMTVLRKPNPGEVAISMSGSPLLVRGDGGSDDPSVTVPLADGRVFQVRGPNSPFQEELKKGLSNEAKLKLRELKNFIDKLI